MFIVWSVFQQGYLHVSFYFRACGAQHIGNRFNLVTMKKCDHALDRKKDVIVSITRYFSNISQVSYSFNQQIYSLGLVTLKSNCKQNKN